MAENTSRAVNEDDKEGISINVAGVPPQHLWYHSYLDRKEAEIRLKSIGNGNSGEFGCYLIRKLNLVDVEAYVLSHLGIHGISHFKITTIDGDYLIGGRHFESLSHVIGYYTDSELLKDEKLKYPVAPPKDNKEGNITEDGTYKNLSYFHTSITIDRAVNKLNKGGLGSFLVRPNDNSKNFTLFVNCGDIIQRFRIEHMDGHLLMGGRFFNSLDDIIERYKTTEILDGVTLCKPIEKEADISTDELSQTPISIEKYVTEEFNDLLEEGSYNLYEMRVMACGEYGAGKTTLIKNIIGDKIPEKRRSTDGIFLYEGRCGVHIADRKWILMQKGNITDLLYEKILMSPVRNQPSKPSDSSIVEDVPNTVESGEEEEYTAVKFNSEGNDTTDDLETFDNPLGGKSPFTTGLKMKQTKKLKPKLTKDAIRKQLELALKKGTYSMKIGRLVFWDFGGQYVYYTTHQTFLTYRALFLLILDGSKGIHGVLPDCEYFPGLHGSPTHAVFLEHWVNSILTYCKRVMIGFSKILFVATHKDLIEEGLVESIRKSLYDDIECLFKKHEGYQHLVLNHRIFVNAKDENDTEIEMLKNVITDLTFEHPSWGEKMPNSWVPLELEIAKLVMGGKNLLSLDELQDLNHASEVFVLSSEQIELFLHVQHTLGKIVYFNNPRLRNFVVINPLFLVDVMRSFITDKQFWPKETGVKDAFRGMTSQGIIRKEDLFAIWKRKEFSEIWPFREYIFDTLVYLDILSEKRRYDKETGSRLPIEHYFVPCMLTKQNNTRYMEIECIPKKSICLAFAFQGTVLPPALPNRLISSCLSMWNVKTYQENFMLYTGFVVLAVEKSLDLVICLQNNMILVYLVHRSSKELIVRDTASSIRECMYTALERISQTYHTDKEGDKVEHLLPFQVQMTCFEMTCFIQHEELEKLDTWICPVHELEHQRHDLQIWYSDPAKEECEQDCTGLGESALSELPSDLALRRFAVQFSPSTMYELAIHLGSTKKTWDTIRYDHPENIEDTMFLILWHWRETKKGTYQQLLEAVKSVEETEHRLCQVRRIRRIETNLPTEYMDASPTDEILDALAPLVGLKSFHLGIELGLKVSDLQSIQYSNKGDLSAQTRSILYTWRDDDSFKSTIRDLMQALTNIDKGTFCLEKVIDDLGLKRRLETKQGKPKDGVVLKFFKKFVKR